MRTVEIVVVTLLVFLLFQWFQTSPEKDPQTAEPISLVTAPEPQPAIERVRLLLDDQLNPLPDAPEPTEPSPAEATHAIPRETVEPITPSTAPELPVTPEAEPTAIALITASENQPDFGLEAPAPKAPQPSSRREEVWALLDQATAEGIEGYNALLTYVKDKSGKGTSKSTIQAWKKIRAEAVTCG